MTVREPGKRGNIRERKSESHGDKLHRIVGPASSQKDGWALPVLAYFPDPATILSEYKKEVGKLRRRLGLEAERRT